METIALCVGHSRRIEDGRAEGGAEACDRVTTEWIFNDGLARLIAAALHDTHGLAARVINDYGVRNYRAAMEWLGAEIGAMGTIRLAVELHFNSGAPSAGGHEWIHYPGSLKGKLAATEMHLAMCRDFRGIRPRGVMTPVGGRGMAFLKATPCPAVIAEPFFGTNKDEWAAVRACPERLGATLAAGIANAHARL